MKINCERLVQRSEHLRAAYNEKQGFDKIPRDSSSQLLESSDTKGTTHNNTVPYARQVHISYPVQHAALVGEDMTAASSSSSRPWLAAVLTCAAVMRRYWSSRLAFKLEQ